ncbi:hypothetical protein I4F81_008925 [Pyropia yezoensis]|uniref:Uncharacterized protein n=1 Tax=Pyropia yezoensis TaxID=2788 RepID=A0ACC3C8V3_PYRYE|nr:hypothetical protein I4F81_008925 [Neopyropia yezoensis]
MNSSPMNGTASYPLRSYRGRAIVLVIAAAGALFVCFAVVFPPSLSSLRSVRRSAGADPRITGTSGSTLSPEAAAVAAVGGVTAPRPAWCDALVASPLPAGGGGCHPSSAANCGPGVPPRFYGQFGQDAWLYSQHFRFLKRPGVFFDVAANEAFGISNTYVFEACLGWKGICVEPNTRYLRALHTHRTCELVPLCLAEKPKTVTFIDYLGLSGIAETNKNLNGSASWQRPVRSAPRRQIDCTTATEVLRRTGLTHIDFMSLDVEGAELAVLEGIDWSHTRIDVIALEEESADAGALAFLVARGYRPVYFNPERKEDVICFHPDVKIGEPSP